MPTNRPRPSRPDVITVKASDIARGDWLLIDSTTREAQLVVAAFAFGGVTTVQTSSGQWSLPSDSFLVWTGHTELPALAPPATPEQATMANPFWDHVEEMHARELAVNPDLPPLPDKPAGDSTVLLPPVPVSPPPPNATVDLQGEVVGQPAA